MSPIQLLLTCPACGKRHVDAGEFATRPHHTHACQHCGLVWRPAVEHTVGVQFLDGFRDDTKSDPGPLVQKAREPVIGALVHFYSGDVLRGPEAAIVTHIYKNAAAAVDLTVFPRVAPAAGAAYCVTAVKNGIFIQRVPTVMVLDVAMTADIFDVATKWKHAHDSLRDFLGAEKYEACIGPTRDALRKVCAASGKSLLRVVIDARQDGQIDGHGTLQLLAAAYDIAMEDGLKTRAARVAPLLVKP